MSSKLVYRAEVEEWEEPLHPGSLSRTYPTSSHNATPIAHFLPLFPPRAADRARTPAHARFPGAPAAGVPERRDARARADHPYGISIAAAASVQAALGNPPGATIAFHAGPLRSQAWQASTPGDGAADPRSRRGDDRVRLFALERHSHRSRGRDPRLGAAVRRCCRAPHRHPEDGCVDRRAHASPARPTPTCACSPPCRHPAAPRLTSTATWRRWLGPDAGIFLSSLNASEESRIGGLLSQLARGLLGGASAANAFPFGSARRAGSDRARHERRRQGTLVP